MKKLFQWTLDGCASMGNLDVVYPSGRIAMLDCENEEITDKQLMENARLIASAPDLLAALHGVDEFCQQGLNSPETVHWEAALQDIMGLVRCAIAKAKGATA